MLRYVASGVLAPCCAPGSALRGKALMLQGVWVNDGDGHKSRLQLEHEHADELIHDVQRPLVIPRNTTNSALHAQVPNITLYFSGLQREPTLASVREVGPVRYL
jgi:hypothetical protein